MPPHSSTPAQSLAAPANSTNPTSHASTSIDPEDPASISPSAPTLAVVVPCYNEEAVLPDTHAKLSAKLAELIDSGCITAQSFLCYVDDGSRDRTWEALMRYARSQEPSMQAHAQDRPHARSLDSVPPPPRMLATKRCRASILKPA